MTETGAELREPGSLERGLLAIVVGLIAAVLVIVSVEPLLRRLYPIPELNPLRSAEEVARASASLPTTTAVLLLVAYALASLVGGFACSLTYARRAAWPVVTMAVVLMIAGSSGVMAVYQPFWFRAASFLTYPMAWVGHLLVRKAVR